MEQVSRRFCRTGVDLGRARTQSLNSEQLNHTTRAALQVRVCSYNACTSVSNNGTINWSTMGPTLSIFIRNTGNNNMSCDLMNNNKTTMNNHKTALLQLHDCRTSEPRIVYVHVASFNIPSLWMYRWKHLLH